MFIKNRGLFRATRFILLRLPFFLKFFSKLRKPQKCLLIVKTDAIGDYVLFRNFIEILKKSPDFNGHRVHLLGNKLWQDLALKYDSQFIEKFYFVDPDNLYESPAAVLKLGWQLFKNNYNTVLHSTFARTLIADGLVGLSAAKKIIGFEGGIERIDTKYKSKTDRFYTEKLRLPPGIEFEFERSIFFFEQVLSKKISLDGPFMQSENGKREGIIIFPGTGVAKRNWDKDNFVDLIKLIKQHSNQLIYLAGGAAETKTGDYITANLLPGSVENLIGKTSLPQLVELIGNAALVVANETSAVHIAAATQTSAICILGGGHFGRFAPYPDHIEKKPMCLYEKMECYHCNWNCRFKTDDNTPFPCISSISVEKVWLSAISLLPDL
jgi:ADP-heptose:LPS heptosyltransferase